MGLKYAAFHDFPKEEVLDDVVVDGDGPAFNAETYDKLTIQRGAGSARTLFHQGDNGFHPAGAPSALVRFSDVDGTVTALEIHNPGLIVSALRAGS